MLPAPPKLNEVYDFNPRAQRAYEKAGFVREGVRHEPYPAVARMWPA